MNHCKTLVYLLVCFAVFQISSGLRVRRQSNSSGSSMDTGTVPSTPDNGTTNGTNSAGSSMDNGTITSTPDNSPVGGGSSAGSSGGSGGTISPPSSSDDPVQRLTNKVREALANPGSLAEIEAEFQNLRIQILGLDEATAAGMSANTIKAMYLLYLLNSDVDLNNIFEGLSEKLKNVK